MSDGEKEPKIHFIILFYIQEYVNEYVFAVSNQNCLCKWHICYATHCLPFIVLNLNEQTVNTGSISLVTLIHIFKDKGCALAFHPLFIDVHNILYIRRCFHQLYWQTTSIGCITLHLNFLRRILWIESFFTNLKLKRIDLTWILSLIHIWRCRRRG